LLVLGDLHCDRRHLRDLVERAVEERGDALVSLGDLCYLPRDPEGRRFLRSPVPCSVAQALELLLVEGTHDDTEALAGGGSRRCVRVRAKAEVDLPEPRGLAEASLRARGPPGSCRKSWCAMTGWHGTPNSSLPRKSLHGTEGDIN
jgi:hypothetical protein